MTLEEAKQLQVGDEVYWNDPDDSLCSRYYRILDLRWHGDILEIWDVDGSHLECVPEELT